MLWQIGQTQLLKTKKEKTCILIYVAISADRNVMPKDVEHEMYDYASNNWAHQNSNKCVNEHLEAKPGTHSIDSLQKIAILGTLHIIQKVLQVLQTIRPKTTLIQSGHVLICDNFFIYTHFLV